MIFVCFIHVFSLELVYERGLRLVGLKKEAFQVKGSKLACFTSRACFHESWTHLFVMSHPCLPSHEPTFLSRVVNYSRVMNFPFCHDSWTTHESSTFQNFKSHNFLDLSIFLVLGIISSTDVQIKWFKLLWKLTQSTTIFMKKLSWENIFWMDKNTLEHTTYAWMVTLGIVWCLSEFLSIN